MAKFVLLSLLFHILLLPLLGTAISSCNGTCRYSSDCGSMLTCIDGKCQDNLHLGTHICGGGSSYLCKPISLQKCPDGIVWPFYDCSPRVTRSTLAKLKYRDFSQGHGYPSECDGKYHATTEQVVSLSTGWYNGGSRCGKMIMILASNGRSLAAKVVDECESFAGCDEMHGGEPPCGNNVVKGSEAVWKGIGLNKDYLGEVDITWSMA